MAVNQPLCVEQLDPHWMEAGRGHSALRDLEASTGELKGELLVRRATSMATRGGEAKEALGSGDTWALSPRFSRALVLPWLLWAFS